MLNENHLATALKSVEYQRIARLIYKATWSSPQVEHFVYFSAHGTPEQFLNAHFGFRNPAAESFSVTSIQKYGTQVFGALKHDIRTDCLMRFSFHRLKPAMKRWAIDTAALSGEEVAHIVEGNIRAHLLPMIRAITDLSELFRILVANSEPYPWVASNAAIRAAHIVAVAMQLGLDQDEIYGALVAHQRQIAAPNSGLVNAGPYVSNLISDWSLFAASD